MPRSLRDVTSFANVHTSRRARVAQLFGLVLVLCATSLARAQSRSCAIQVDVAGVINSATTSYVLDGLRETEARKCAALLLVIDTPGGTLDATRDIVRALLNARIPVIAYVAPAGARAGSAGMFVTLAAHIAAMAPGTNIGAAHPVLGTGRDVDEGGGKHLAKKLENDTAALARAIAKERGRNQEFAESAVRDSISLTAGEALERKAIDRIANSQALLLRDLDGHTITISGRTSTLEFSNIDVITLKMTIQQRVLSILGDPNLVYLLMMLGMLGVMIELYHPGFMIAGGIGVFFLLLAAIGLNALPVHAGGLILIAVAFALLVAELFITSHGFLMLGAAVALAIGSALLIDRNAPGWIVDPSFSVSWGVIAPLVIAMIGGAALLAWRLRKSHYEPEITGANALLGKRADTLSLVDAHGGQVRIRGELWQARSAIPLEPGRTVKVTAIEGLCLYVEPLVMNDNKEDV